MQWIVLSTSEKSKHYEAWVRDPEIGGALSAYVNLSDVRVYLKDTLMKDYANDAKVGIDAFERCFNEIGIGWAFAVEPGQQI